MNRRWPAAILLAMLCAPGTAAAQHCWVDMGNIDFGTVNGVGQSASTVNGQMNVRCNNAYTLYVRVCIGLGAPVNDSWDPRYMSGSFGRLLDYNIYSDPFHTQIWGNAYSPAGTLVAVDVPIQYGGGGGNGNRNVTYYAKVPVQNDARGSSYSARFSSDHATVRASGYFFTPPICTTNVPIVSHFNFEVRATVRDDCAISASPLEFGTVGAALQDTPVDATSTISATCTTGAPYTLSLDRGQGPLATVANRRMARAGGVGGGVGNLQYELYRDAAHRQPWGDGGLGTQTVAGTGAGINSPRVHTVYGRLPTQNPPQDGVYADTVTVTVAY